MIISKLITWSIPTLSSLSVIHFLINRLLYWMTRDISIGRVSYCDKSFLKVLWNWFPEPGYCQWSPHLTEAILKPTWNKSWKRWVMLAMPKSNLSFASASISASSSLSFNSFSTDILNSRMSLMYTVIKIILVQLWKTKNTFILMTPWYYVWVPYLPDSIPQLLSCIALTN